MNDIINFNIYKEFDKDASWFSPISIICTVKSFDVSAIRARYLKSRYKSDGNIGSVERRKPSEGGIVHFKLNNGNIEKEVVLGKMLEPRGIASNSKYLAIASENCVYVFSKTNVIKINHDWFSYIHSLDFSPNNPDLILIASSGLDCVFEYDVGKKCFTKEWYAWEKYKNKAKDPETQEELILTKYKEEAEVLEAKNKNVLLIENPKTQYLPTAKRAAFINTVSYSSEKESCFLATLFHEGRVIEFNFQSNKFEILFENLNTPHGGFAYANSNIVTSTSDGVVIVKKGDKEFHLDFDGMPGKAEAMTGKEWLQNSRKVNSNTILTIDANRNLFILIDVENKKYYNYKFNTNWAVQDFVEVSSLLLNLETIKDYDFEK